MTPPLLTPNAELSRDPAEVKARQERYLRRELADVIAIVPRDQAIQYLVEILKTPVGEITVNHRLAQSYDAKSGKIELPSKLGAMQLLAKMCRCSSATAAVRSRSK
jgi:hypothetical protein